MLTEFEPAIMFEPEPESVLCSIQAVIPQASCNVLDTLNLNDARRIARNRVQARTDRRIRQLRGLI